MIYKYNNYGLNLTINRQEIYTLVNDFGKELRIQYQEMAFVLTLGL